MLEIGVDCVTVFPLGHDRRATIRSFNGCVDELTSGPAG